MYSVWGNLCSCRINSQRISDDEQQEDKTNAMCLGILMTFLRMLKVAISLLGFLIGRAEVFLSLMIGVG